MMREGSAVMSARMAAIHERAAVPQIAASEIPPWPAAKHGKGATTPVGAAVIPAETAAARSLPAAMPAEAEGPRISTAAALTRRLGKPEGIEEAVQLGGVV